MVLIGGTQRHAANTNRDIRTAGADLLTARFRVRIPTPEPISEIRIRGSRQLSIDWLTAFVQHRYSNADPIRGLPGSSSEIRFGLLGPSRGATLRYKTARYGRLK